MEFVGNEQVALYSVRELLQMAFHGEHRVDFKLIQIILLVLARRLNVLNRKVHLNVSGLKRVPSDVFVEEVRVHANRILYPPKGPQKPDFDRDNILVVYTVPGEEEDIKLSRGRMRRPDVEMKSLATRDLYTNLREQVAQIEKKLKIVNASVPEWLNKALPITHPDALLQLGARLQKTESNIEDLTTSLISLASKITKGERADRSSMEHGNKHQKLIVGYVMISPSSVKTSKKPRNRGRKPDWETGKIEDSERVSRVTGSKAGDRKGLGAKSTMSKPLGLSEEVLDDGDEAISQKELVQNLQALKDLILKDFNARAKKIKTACKAVETEFSELKSRVFRLQPIQDALQELDGTLKRCFSRQNQLNKDALQLGVHQDTLLELQQSADDATEKMQEVIANRKSDVDAINQLHTDMFNLGADCQVLHTAQKEIAQDQKDFCKELKGMLKEILELNKIKCSRQEFWDALKTKAGLFDLNTFMSSVHFAANYGELQRVLATKVDKFQAREYTWQRQIDEIYIKFHDTVGIDQLKVVDDDSRNKTAAMRKKIDHYIDIIAPYQRVDDHEETKTREEPKCLSCYTTVNKPFFNLPAKETEGEDTKCYFSAPIPKDKRCLKHIKPCQKNIEKGDITSAMIVSSLKKAVPAAVPEALEPIKITVENKIRVPCKPCNKFKMPYKAKPLPMQWTGK